MIHFQDVSKSFGRHQVLDHLELKIPEGQITVILGKSGEGKSVTIKHIMGLLKPDHGRIMVDDEDVTTFTHAQLIQYRKKFGMLFQQAALFDSLSVRENVVFPLREHTRMNEVEMNSRCTEVLEQVGLQGFEEKFPGELSTGEKKRVGLARALANYPKIILYDEPTTGMDPLVSEMIDGLIVRVNQLDPKLTSIVISHDLKAALKTASHVVMLYKGRVQLAGSPEEFLKSKDPIIRQFFAGRVEGPMEFF